MVIEEGPGEGAEDAAQAEEGLAAGKAGSDISTVLCSYSGRLRQVQ